LCTLPTIVYALRASQGILACIWRPKGKPNPKYSLRRCLRLRELLIRAERIYQRAFSPDCIAKCQRARRQLESGQVLLLENLRYHPEEKPTIQPFHRSGRAAEVYVNDASLTIALMPPPRG